MDPSLGRKYHGCVRLGHATHVVAAHLDCVAEPRSATSGGGWSEVVLGDDVLHPGCVGDDWAGAVFGCRGGRARRDLLHR